jgi:hypothetical protein
MGWDVFSDPKWLLDNLLRKYNVIILPSSGWYAVAAGSGGYGVASFFLQLWTGTTANSSEKLTSQVLGLSDPNTSMSYVRWDRDFDIRFVVVRLNSDPECVARVQLKESSALGALSQPGVGIEIANYLMRGEGYGTARGTVDLLTMTGNREYRVRIVKKATTLQFFVENVLMGTLSGSYVPNSPGTATAYFVISINNGSTGGVNANFFIGDIKIVQKR